MRTRAVARRVIRYLSRNAIASLALFIALAGTSYAALQLPANSVGTKQIRNSAVTLKKISKSTRRALAGKRGPGGSQGPKGDAGRSALTPLGAGETERGTYAVGGPAYQAGSSFFDGVTFQIPLAGPLDESHVVYVTGASAAHCPGRGSAENGYLCLYETASNSFTSLKIVDPTSATAASGASTEGFLVAVNSIGINPAVYSLGTWAVSG